MSCSINFLFEVKLVTISHFSFIHYIIKVANRMQYSRKYQLILYKFPESFLLGIELFPH